MCKSWWCFLVPLKSVLSCRKFCLLGPCSCFILSCGNSPLMQVHHWDVCGERQQNKDKQQRETWKFHMLGSLSWFEVISRGCSVLIILVYLLLLLKYWMCTVFPSQQRSCGWRDLSVSRGFFVGFLFCHGQMINSWINCARGWASCITQADLGFRLGQSHLEEKKSGKKKQTESFARLESSPLTVCPPCLEGSLSLCSVTLG